MKPKIKNPAESDYAVQHSITLRREIDRALDAFMTQTRRSRSSVIDEALTLFLAKQNLKEVRP